VTGTGDSEGKLAAFRRASVAGNFRTEEDGWVPAFPGQRPPFAKGHEYRFAEGNELGLRHGAFSPRRVDPLASELVDLVLNDPATQYLQAAHWRPAVWAWAKAEAQVQLLEEYLARRAEDAGDGVGDLGDERVRSAYLLHHRASSRAMSGRRQLGLDPLSAARLGRDKAAAGVDMAQLMAQLHRMEQAGITVLESDDEEDGDDG
jgi:hypothetical protein